MSLPAPSVSGVGLKGIWQPPSLAEMQALLPDYQFMALIGRGGMGAVFKAIQISLNRPVAIKVLPEDLTQSGDATFVARFRQEALTMARLSHPGIVSVFEAGEAQGFLYIVMEFVEGTDVAHMIQREGKVKPELATKLLTQVCDALQYAHQNNVVHRDIKPANLLLTRDGVLKIADFGLAKHQDDALLNLTKTNVAIGTPDFLAPEAWTPETPLDARADLYAVGVTLYQMLTGEIPRGFWEMPSARVGTDARFDAIIERAMQPKPEARYQSSAELRRDLEKIRTEPRKTPDLSAVSESPSFDSSRALHSVPTRRPGPLAISLAAAALALVAGIIILALPRLRDHAARPVAGTHTTNLATHLPPTMRDAARWLVREKAQFKIVSQDVEFEVKTEQDIPTGEFQIVYLWFDRWVSSPPLEPPPEEEFEVLHAVTTLRYAFIRLPGLSDARFAFLAGNPDLQVLHITCPERVTDQVLVHLAQLKKLEILTISHSPRFTGRGLAGSAWLGNIQEVDFLQANLAKDALQLLATCPRLERVMLEGTSITKEGLRALAVRKLTLLNVGNCPKLTEDDLIEVLPEFGRLRKLELPYSDVGDAVVDAVATLTNLTELRLSGTKLTDAGLAKLAPLRRLEFIELSHTRVTEEGIATFEKTHPQCKIGH